MLNFEWMVDELVCEPLTLVRLVSSPLGLAVACMLQWRSVGRVSLMPRGGHSYIRALSCQL